MFKGAKVRFLSHLKQDHFKGDGNCGSIKSTITTNLIQVSTNFVVLNDHFGL